eukprot:6213393-Pleurochrysis_carterae.AAC.1
MIRRPPRSTQGVSSAASDVYKRQARESERERENEEARERRDLPAHTSYARSAQLLERPLRHRPRRRRRNGATKRCRFRRYYTQPQPDRRCCRQVQMGALSLGCLLPHVPFAGGQPCACLRMAAAVFDACRFLSFSKRLWRCSGQGSQPRYYGLCISRGTAWPLCEIQCDAAHLLDLCAVWLSRRHSPVGDACMDLFFILLLPCFCIAVLLNDQSATRKSAWVA